VVVAVAPRRMRCLLLCVAASLLCVAHAAWDDTPELAAPLPPSQARSLHDACITYLRCVQLTSACDGAPGRVNVRAGRGGGIGSMIQLLLQAAMSILPERPASVSGSFQWYSNNSACNRVGDIGVGCHFEPIVPLLEQTFPHSTGLPAGTCDDPKPASACAALDPGKDVRGRNFRSFFWWGVLHSAFLRPSPRLSAILHAERALLGMRRSPDVTVHARLGDKLTDEMSRQSGKGMSVALYVAAAEELVARHLQACGCDQDTGASVADAHGRRCRRVVVFVATDTASALPALRAWAAKRNTTVELKMHADTHTQTITRNSPSLQVARLDKRPMAQRPTADELSRLADEAVVDLMLLAEGRLFAGCCMSQIARIVVSTGFARGTLEDAIAVDSFNIPHVDQWKAGLREGWRPIGTGASRPVLHRRADECR
jgi:hypothetical protein